jgi:hypothetical protein
MRLLSVFVALLLAGCYGPLELGGQRDDDDDAADDETGDDDAADDDAADDDTGDDDAGDDDTGDDDTGDDDAADDDAGDDDAGDDDTVDPDLVDDDGDGYTEQQGDCDDEAASTYPGAPEDGGTGTNAGNDVDDDCDGTIDEGTTWYDDDGDGFSEAELDCNDTDPNRYPYAPEDGGTGTGVGNGIDDDCDGTIDEGTTWYDDDGDGYSEGAGDCNDLNALAYPGAPEVLGNNIDDDCDGQIDEVPNCDCPSTASLTSAMDVCTGLVSSSVTGPSSAVRSSFGLYVPTGGCRMIALSSGVIGGSVQNGTDFGAYGAPGDTTTLNMTLSVPAWANSFSFDLNFMSAEYPEWVGSPYNDFFFANLTSGAFTGNVSFDANGTPIEINNAFFSVTSPAALAGTGFQNVGGGTGWLTTTAPVLPGETITLQMTIGDVSDGLWDSTVLLDNFAWGAATVGNPNTQQ